MIFRRSWKLPDWEIFIVYQKVKHSSLFVICTYIYYICFCSDNTLIVAMINHLIISFRPNNQRIVNRVLAWSHETNTWLD
jgi:hypothetical protein